jgi:hypothetical protein
MDRGVGPELRERHKTRARDVARKPLAVLANIDHVDLAAGNQ